jgi:hypothetical protein
MFWHHILWHSVRRGIEGLQVDGNESMDWRRVDLQEVLKLMEDLIGYFAQPRDELDFESRQNRFRALRSRQDLFQAEGVLNMILETMYIPDILKYLF